MKKDSKEPRMDHDPVNGDGLSPESTSPGEKRRKPDAPPAEPLPLGTGYNVMTLPTEVTETEATLIEETIPDLIKEAVIQEELDEPIEAPEDEFYDFEKDIYGDETEFKP